MKIGDRVRYISSFDNTYHGVIVGEKNFKCKCKSKDKWLLDLDGYVTTISVPKDSKTLTVINPLEIEGNITKHEF